MTEFQRQIIADLISKPRTAQQLGWDLEVDWADVVEALNELKLAGQVATKLNVAPGDARCERCGAEVEEVEPGDSCGTTLAGGELVCGGYLMDICIYAYCGGPISKALEAAA